MTVGIVCERLSQADAKLGFLLDGFPRTLEQVVQLSKVLAEMDRRIDVAIQLNVDIDKLLVRLTGRRVCRSCGLTYHLMFNPPQAVGKCNRCMGDLYHRPDDSMETVIASLELNVKMQKPLLYFYERKGLLRSINGEADIEHIFQDISGILRSYA